MSEGEFDILGTNESVDINEYLPMEPVTDYAPSEKEMTFVIMRLAGNNLQQCCRAARISVTAYYERRKTKEGFVEWLDAFVAQFYRTRARSMLEWVTTKGFDILKGIAGDGKDNSKIAAIREIKDITALLHKMSSEAKNAEAAPVEIGEGETITDLIEDQRERRKLLLQEADLPIVGSVRALGAGDDE